MNTESEKTIQRVRILFVNGYLSSGMFPAGEKYWNRNFVSGALEYFNSSLESVFIRYNPVFSTPFSRFVNGIGYVKQKITLLTGNMEKDSDHFVLIAHSMGTAYAEGIAEGLRRNGWNVDYLLSLNAFQFGLVKPYCTPTKIIDYRNTDDLLSPDCNVMGAYLQIREKSVPYKGNAHIYPVWGCGKKFWSKLPPRDTLTETRLA